MDWYLNGGRRRMKKYKTRICKQESENKIVYYAEYLHEGWIFNKWIYFSSLDASCIALAAWRDASKKSQNGFSSLEFAKDVIDTYLEIVEEKEKATIHHETKKTTYIDYP